MKLGKRLLPLFCAWMLLFSGPILTQAQTNSDALNHIQQEIYQNSNEKQTINTEIESIQQEISSLNTYILENKEATEDTLQRIAETNQLIEKKKEDIVALEDKIFSRKDVMSKRLVALQDDKNFNIIIEVLFNAKSLDDFFERAFAVTTLLNADNDILEQQQADLQQIEDSKKEIDRQQQILEKDKEFLSNKQEELNQNLEKREETLDQLQEKYKQINQQIVLAKEEKASIEGQIRSAQEIISREKEVAQKQAVEVGNIKPQSKAAKPQTGQELYVTATAYSPEESGSVTATGYNIKANPNMKLIAVDPKLIPLGKKVWVEGYGEAIAGDTGSAIKGHKIDVLMPTREDALSWGRKTVKIVVLD